MDDTEKPDLSFSELAQITDELQEMDSALWECLLPMLMPKNGIPEGVILAGPRPPKLSAKFYVVLSNYSIGAFNIEVRTYPRYPPHPNFYNWLLNLARRVEDHAVEVVNDIECRPEKSFSYHGITEDEMRRAIQRALHKFMEDRYGVKPAPPSTPPSPYNYRPQLAAPTPSTAPASFRSTLTGKEISAYTGAGIDIDSPPPLVVALHEQEKESARISREMPTPIAGELPELQKEITRRARLLTDYKTATGAKDYNLYNAQNSGIHKPEFYRWVHGKLPSKSKTAKRFEAFLTAKRRPVRKKPATE